MACLGPHVYQLAVVRTFLDVRALCGHGRASPAGSSHTITGVNPNGLWGVGTNATPTVYFSERVNPLSITTGNFILWDSITAKGVPATISVAADQLSATLIPAQALQPNTSYSFNIGTSPNYPYWYYGCNQPFYDIAGNSMGCGQWSFVTGNGPVTTAPVVSTISPPAGATGTPVNTQVVAVLSTQLNANTVGQSAITVTPQGGSTPVAGTVTLAGDLVTLTWVPAAPLAASTTYTVTVGGFRDPQGNTVIPFTSSFTTGASATPVGAGSLTVVSATPANGATITDNTTPVVITFSAPINPATVKNILVRDLSNNSYNIAGTWAVNPNDGAQVTFTPTTPYPGSSSIQVWTQNAVKDLAGNTDTAWVVTTFTTAGVADSAQPTVTSVTPANNATGIGRNAIISLTFSKSINPGTVNGTSLQMFVGTASIGTGTINFSSDNRTVTFTPTTPAGETITIVATSAIKDLSGNSLVDFQSRFQTAEAIPANSPQVVTVRPGNGAINVSPNAVITLFTNGNPLNLATVEPGLHVAQNGVLVPGAIQLTGNNRAIEFTPSAPLAYGAVIQVFLDSTVQDIYGNALQSFSGQFTVQGSPSAAPQLVAANPANGATNLPLNVVPQFSFDQPLAAATVNATSVRLMDGCTWQAVPGTVSLASGGDVAGGNNVVQFQADNPLTSTCNGNPRYYYLQMNNFDGTVTNTNGVAAPGVNYYFYVGAASDTTTPAVVSVVPSNGATDVGINASVFVRFSKPINPISATLLHTGKVLVIAGSENDANNHSTGAESYRNAIWDPAGTDASSITVQNIDYDVFCSGTAQLPHGRTLTIGGSSDYSFKGDKRASIFDPATEEFVQSQDMADGRWYGTATALGDGRIMAFSGLGLSGSTNKTVQIYDLANAGAGWGSTINDPFTPPLYPRTFLRHPSTSATASASPSLVDDDAGSSGSGGVTSCSRRNSPERWISSERTRARANTSPPGHTATGACAKRCQPAGWS